jgi:hypothetical protein
MTDKGAGDVVRRNAAPLGVPRATITMLEVIYFRGCMSWSGRPFSTASRGIAPKIGLGVTGENSSH